MEESLASRADEGTSILVRPVVDSVIVFCMTFLACYFLFEGMRPTVLFGDDLSNYLAYKAGEFARMDNLFAETFANKYRPIFGLAWALMIQVAGIDLHKIFLINILLQSILAVLVYLSFACIPRIPRLLLIFCAIFIGASRFSLYQVTQLTGLVESVSALFFFLAFYFLASDFKGGFKPLHYVYSILALSLAVFTHERYLAAVPWFAVAWVVAGWDRRISTRIWVLALPVAVVLLNISVKLALGSRVLEGTSYTKISLIPGEAFFANFGQAIATLFGFNHAPEHVGGASLLAREFAWNWPWIALIPISLAVVFYLLLSVRSQHRIFGMKPAHLIGAVAVLAVFMLIPPAFTVRLDQRWLLVPQFAIVLCSLLAVGALYAKRRRLAASMLVVHCCLWVPLFFLLRPSLNNIFFIESGLVATQVNKTVLPLVEKTSRETKVRFVMREDHCTWTLLDGHFFAVYGSGNREVRCFPSEVALNVKMPNQTGSSIAFVRDSKGNFVPEPNSMFCGRGAKIRAAGISEDGWMGRSASSSIHNCSGFVSLSFYLPKNFQARSIVIYANENLLGSVSVPPDEIISVRYAMGDLPVYDLIIKVDGVDRPSGNSVKNGDKRELGVVVSKISTTD